MWLDECISHLLHNDFGDWVTQIKDDNILQNKSFLKRQYLIVWSISYDSVNAFMTITANRIIRFSSISRLPTKKKIFFYFLRPTPSSKKAKKIILTTFNHFIAYYAGQYSVKIYNKLPDALT